MTAIEAPIERIGIRQTKQLLNRSSDMIKDNEQVTIILPAPLGRQRKIRSTMGEKKGEIKRAKIRSLVSI